MKIAGKELQDLGAEVRDSLTKLQGEVNEIELDTIQLQAERSGLDDEVEVGLMTEEEAEERRQEIDEACQDNQGEMDLLKIRMNAAREEGQKRIDDFHMSTLNLIKGRLQRWERKLAELQPEHPLVVPVA